MTIAQKNMTIHRLKRTPWYEVMSIYRDKKNILLYFELYFKATMLHKSNMIKDTNVQ